MVTNGEETVTIVEETFTSVAQLSTAKGGDPEGSWTCGTCGNVNWPLRTTCNNKACGLPRDMASYSEVSPQEGGGTDGGSSEGHPEGSWTCLVCNNVNWPLRTVCNRKNCGEPRPF